MFFYAYLGARPELAAWDQVLERHATWLGLTPHTHARQVADGRIFSFGWLAASPPNLDTLVHETPERVTVATLESLSPLDDALQSRRNYESVVTQVQASLLTGELKVHVPVVTIEQVFFATRGDSIALSSDFRLLARWAGFELDERGVYGLFEYCIIAPTLSLSRTVQRLPGGHLCTFGPEGGEPRMERLFQQPRPIAGNPPDRVVDGTRDVLDGLLSKAAPSSAVLFSGGVDSGLIAARLAAMGRKDVLLLNFARGPDDPESNIAHDMAAHLRMPYERVYWQASAALPALDRMGREYSFPQSDPATIPTLMLVDVLRDKHPRPPMVLDGNGAYACFAGPGMEHQFGRVYGAPKLLRGVAAVGYHAPGFWKHDSRISRLATLASQSLEMPVPMAITLAHRDSMHGRAYTVPQAARKDFEAIVRDRVAALTDGMGVPDQASFWDLLYVEAGHSVAKSLDPLRNLGIRSVCPYEEARMLTFAASVTWEDKRMGSTERKAALSRLLARSVPREWVFRKRGGFLLPFRETYSDPGVRGFIEDVVLAKDNPLLQYCQMGVVRQIIRRAGTGQTLSQGARRFLWTLVFTSAWLRQIE